MAGTTIAPVQGAQDREELTVDAVVLARDRRASVETVLDRLEGLALRRVLVADNGSTDGTPDLVRARGGNVELVEMGANLGVAARNVAARHARADLILMLDDDSYPRPRTVELLRAAFRRQPRLGVAGGRIVDVDTRGDVRHRGVEVGSFDWFLRPRGRADAPEDGFPASFFPQGGCMLRRDAFLEVGGCFEPYFFYGEELDLTARMVDAGWEVRYFPGAEFEHRRELVPRGAPGIRRMLRYRIRNQIWYFWLRFPARLAAVRIPLYLAFDLVECAHRGALGSWPAGVRAAWVDRGRVAHARRPLSRSALRRAELDRGRKHLRLLLHGLLRPLRPSP